jgi:hypothetical protein
MSSLHRTEVVKQEAGTGIGCRAINRGHAPNPRRTTFVLRPENTPSISFSARFEKAPMQRGFFKRHTFGNSFASWNFLSSILSENDDKAFRRKHDTSA